MVRSRVHPTGLVVVVCSDDVVFEVDVAITFVVDFDCDKNLESFAGCEGNVVGTVAAEAMWITTGLRDGCDGLLGRVGNTEASTIVVLVFP